ncbi:M23 family metallopeptidase [Streptomyces sp. Caat 7-52]|uniref:M23 family metallopeptidase n=1 Tax=Streptomyces sp. Caat 7-52 TaxID=2949637 RepID=UPI002034F220|nr:M23 family metallopeptidase [Streptomyces sp. Caat 7-52]
MHRTRKKGRACAAAAAVSLLGTGLGLGLTSAAAAPMPAAAPSLATNDGQAAITPVVASPTTVPVPVRGTDGRTHLAYELTLVNESPLPATLTSVSVTEQNGHRPLLKLTGNSLKTHFRPSGSAPDAAPTDQLSPGRQGRVWIDAVLPTGTRFPLRLRHLVSVTYPKAVGIVPKSLTESVTAMTVPDRHPVVLRSPLAGAGWLDGNGCCAQVTPHRAAASPLDGTARFPERFAIDFVRLDSDNRLYTGAVDKVGSYPYYGVPVRAAAAGEIVSVVDNLPDSTPGTSPANLPLHDYAGNHVVEKLRNGEYVLYAHLKPGSTGGRVHAGQQVAVGAQIGQLGNSGNSDAPHLHFQVMDGPDPLASNGLPFVFSSMSLQGNLGEPVDSLFEGKAASITPAAADRAAADDEMPLYLNQVGFPEHQ